MTLQDQQQLSVDVPPSSGKDGGVPAIRLARSEDLQVLRAIERRAGRAFRSLGMNAVADDEPLSVPRLAGYQSAGLAWVAEVNGHVVGYLLLDRMPETAHIEQVSVDPAHARRGIGALLIETASAWARHHNLRALTLTSFELVPWNAPYYARLGFVVLGDADLSPELREVRRVEADHGLDTWPRVAMQLQL